jgi:hypothetical protein
LSGRNGLVRADRQDDDPELDAAAEELVAETVAYSVYASSGIDPGEFLHQLLAGWSERNADHHDRAHRSADRPPLAPHRGRRGRRLPRRTRRRRGRAARADGEVAPAGFAHRQVTAQGRDPARTPVAPEQ